MENTIAVVDDPLFVGHRAPGSHPERPERLQAAQRATLGAKLRFPALHFAPLAPRDATAEELRRVHTEEYIGTLDQARGKRGQLDADTYYAERSVEAAYRAAGGCAAIVDALFDGTARYGLALVRPPGHHARPGGAMGFCLVNNVAVAAAHARSRGAERVAIVDYDVHHGNGTQEIFYDDPSVLYVSLHQFPFYPGTGSTREIGERDGSGYTVNVPLSAGAGDADYVAAFDRIVAPVLSSFDPDLVLVSAGFDAHVRDPLASMRVTERGYAMMLQRISSALPRGAPGRLGIVLEGGYDLVGLEESLRATLEALDAPTVEVPAQGPTHEHDLDAALRAAKTHWRLD